MKKRMLAMALAGAMMVGCLAGCGNSSSSASGSGDGDGSLPHWTVGYSNRDDSSVYLKQLVDELQKLVDADDTLDLITADAKDDPQTQLDQLDNFTVQGVDCVVMAPKDGDSVVDYIEQCNEDGIPVFCNSLSATGGEFTFVGASDYDMGLQIAQYAYENLPENAKVIYLGGDLGYDVSINRRQALVDGLGDRLHTDWNGDVVNEDGDIEVLTWQLCDYSMEDGMNVMEDMIQTFDDFDAVICCNDSTALGAIEAMKGAGITDCMVLGIDALDDAVAAIKDGEMTATVQQDAVVHSKALYDAIKKAQAGEENPEQVNPETVLITADNVNDYFK